MWWAYTRGAYIRRFTVSNNQDIHFLIMLLFYQLFKLVESYSAQEQKVLIVAANQLIQPKRSKAVSTADHREAMAYLRSISTIYFVKHNKR
jgi:hypothetical protein